MSKLKELFTTKVIVYIIVGILVGGYLFFQFFSGGEEAETKINTGGKILVKNEKPLQREFFEGYKLGKERSSLSAQREAIAEEPEHKAKTLDFSSNTDDPDIQLIQDILKGEKPLQDSPAARTTQTKPTNVNITHTPVSSPVKNTVSQPNPIKNEAEKTSEEKDRTDIEIKEDKPNRFFEGRRIEKKGNTLSCAVHGEQTIMSGQTLKLRLLEEYTTPSGAKIAKGTTIWGVCTLSQERMYVQITSILIGKDLIDTELEVFDMDGMKGINLPNNVKAEIARRVKAQSVQEVNANDIVGTGGGTIQRGTAAVVNAAKNVISKKENEIEMTVKSNHKLLLKPISK